MGKYQIDRLRSVDNLPLPLLPLRIQQQNRQLTIRLTIDIPANNYLLILVEEAILSIAILEVYSIIAISS
ncbi:MAG: hypothetical protein HC778_05975 [Chamaesiphon sp. CSU_1_12]|nr:hypothetical protein [Chamaesiphon sp. CSU_1_12]